jgi:hypothetical protein
LREIKTSIYDDDNSKKKEAQMKFIDTDAGRQLLIDSFHAKTAVGFVDPNFLEWQDEWADFPLLDDIKKLYEKWIGKGCLKWIDNPHYSAFTLEVLEYLDEKQEEGKTATYSNFSEYLYGADPREDDPKILIDSVEIYVAYDSEWEYKEEYKESLKSSVAQEYLDLVEKYKED